MRATSKSSGLECVTTHSMNFSLPPASSGSANKKMTFGFNKAKPIKLAVFADSDDEEPGAKRRRVESGCPCSRKGVTLHARRPLPCASERLSSWRDQTPAPHGRLRTPKCARRWRSSPSMWLRMGDHLRCAQRKGIAALQSRSLPENLLTAVAYHNE